jgi:glycosyltransferase involved in cell wall biosynthesis
MKILVLGKYYPPVLGGIETHLRDLALALSREHETTLLVHNESPKDVIDTVDNVRLVRSGAIAKLFNQPISPGMFTHFRRLDPDVVHLHAPNAWTTLVALLMAGSRPLVVSHHADILGREPLRSLVMIGYRRLARRAKVIVVGASNNRTFSHDLKGVEAPGAVIPFCIEPDAHHDDPTLRAEADSLRQARNGVPLAVFVGRLVSYKGVDRMIEALAQVPNLRLAVIGVGPLEAELKAQAARLGLVDRISWLGRCDERAKNTWLAASDFLILPSVTVAEAFGLVQVEAMLWRKPVIATDLPSGVPQVGVHGETGLIVPPDDVQALAEAMSRLADDVELRSRYGEAGYVRARALYSRAAFDHAVLDLFRSIRS